MPPVTYAGKIAGPISRRHISLRGSRNRPIASRRSVGMADAPAITLNSTYHCEPSAISRMPPQFRLTPVARNTAVTSGNSRFAGKLARTWTTGWANRATRGFIPIHTPTGTHSRLEATRSASTRPNVARPSSATWPNSPNPTVRCRYSRARTAPQTATAATPVANATSPARRRPGGTINGCSANPNGRVIRSSPRPTGRSGAATACGTTERRSRSRTTLRGRSAAAASSVRNRSLQATSGRQNSTLTASTRTSITPMAASTSRRLPAAMAAAA